MLATMMRMPKGRDKRKRSPRQQSREQQRVSFPSAPTLFRINHLDRRTQAAIRKAADVAKPILMIRDRERIALVKAAKTPEALVDIAPEASGLAEEVWQGRMRKLGREVIPLIVERLKSAHTLPDPDRRTLLRERLIADLRWRGDAGAEGLLASFDALDDYGRSLASVALGLLRAQAGAGKIWELYTKVVQNLRESYYIGALWGLIDLKDQRAGGALVDLLHRRHTFYELAGFLALAGDARVVVPLLHTTVEAREEDREAYVMALVAIAHRIGREALIAEMARIVPDSYPPDEAINRADQILAGSPAAAEDYFSMYFHGITTADLEQYFASGLPEL